MGQDMIFGNMSRVAVVVGNSQSRDAVAKALNSFRFQEILQFSCPEDLVAFHRFGEVDWIITEMCSWRDFNALKMLESIRSGNINSKVKVSYLIKKPEDLDVLSRAFELGLLSTHNAKYAHADLLTELSELNRVVTRYRGSLPLVAAHYARAYLNETRKKSSILHLERALSRYAPFHPDVLFHLSEAEFMQGNHVDGVRHLRQAALLAPEYAKIAETMQAKFLNEEQVHTINESLTHLDIIGFKSVLIVDHDTAVTQMLTQSLSQAGLTKIAQVQTGDEALDWIKKSGPVDLMITEWKLMGAMTGSALVQRIRQMRSGKIRILVISSLLKKSDEFLLDEIGVEMVLPKPLNQQQFLEALVEMRLSTSGTSSAKMLLRRINGLLAGGNGEAAEPLIQDILAMNDVPEDQKLEVKANWALYKRNYKKALALISQSMALGNSGAGAMTTMGRVLLKLRDYKNASTFLERAQTASPDSIQRLLDLSEAKLAQNDLDGAKADIVKATQIDPVNEWVVMADCQVSIEQGETKVARGLLSGLQSGGEITAQMNNRAIALAQVGKVEESISLYLKTLEALPPAWKTHIAKVTYNLGMAYARNGNYAQAEQTLRKVIGGHDGLSSKAGSLADKIKNALEQGIKLNFQSKELVDLSEVGADDAVPLDVGEISARASIRPGDLCLCGIFSDKDSTASQS
jgi:tetratricopeptide (TPR) repeat protein